jgi:hypothetical protein
MLKKTLQKKWQTGQGLGKADDSFSGGNMLILRFLLCFPVQISSGRRSGLLAGLTGKTYYNFYYSGFFGTGEMPLSC